MNSAWFLRVVSALVTIVAQQSVAVDQINSGDSVDTVTQVTLSPENRTKEVQVGPGGRLTIQVTQLAASPSIAFGVLEVHAYFVNVTVSYNATLSPGFYTTGTNIGLVLLANEDSTSDSGSEDSTFAYLTNDDPRRRVAQILLILQPYDSNAPIPGGCNMEQPIQTAPFLPTRFTASILTVEFPLASWPLGVRSADCDRTPQQYDVYQLYLPEGDRSKGAVFAAIRAMSGVAQAEANGRKISFSGSPPSKLKLANYKGTGRVVVVVARALTSSAAYVPTVSFGCDPHPHLKASANATATGDSELEWEQGCEMLESSWTKLLAACVLFLGIFHALLGHRFYKTHLFLHGFAAASLVAYILLVAFAEFDNTVVHLSTAISGCLGGLFAVLVWCRLDVPLFAVFLGCLLSGFVFASTVAYTPLADFAIMKNDAEFWLAFSSLVLVAPIVLIPFTHLASLVCSALVGSFLAIAVLDLFVGGNLKFILLNVLRRATDDDFRTAVLDPTFQTADGVLTATWALLGLSGLLLQAWRERDRPPFPNRPAWFTSRPSSGSVSIVTHPQELPNEATPLLA